MPQSSLPKAMTAARVHQFGGPTAIILEEVPVPSPAPGAVLVTVTDRARAAALQAPQATPGAPPR